MTEAHNVPDYRVFGSGNHTVYLLHGAYGCSDYWTVEAEVLANAGYRVIAWDAPGYGISPLPTAGYSIEYLAQRVADLVRATSAADSHNVILGHSMGGLIAPLATTLVPERVQALIISATVESLGHTSKEFQESFLRERLEPLNNGVTLREAAARVIQSMLSPNSSGAAIDKVKRVTCETPDETFKAAITAITQFDGRAVLRDLAVPTLCIAGEYDPVGQPSIMETMAENIPNAEYVCITDAGHYAWAEQTAAFNNAVFNFLNRVYQDV